MALLHAVHCTFCSIDNRTGESERGLANQAALQHIPLTYLQCCQLGNARCVLRADVVLTFPTTV